MLELKGVVSGYGNITALKSIDLSVPEGKIVSLIGANGAVNLRLCVPLWGL